MCAMNVSESFFVLFLNFMMPLDHHGPATILIYSKKYILYIKMLNTVKSDYFKS